MKKSLLCLVIVLVVVKLSASSVGAETIWINAKNHCGKIKVKFKRAHCYLSLGTATYLKAKTIKIVPLRIILRKKADDYLTKSGQLFYEVGREMKDRRRIQVLLNAISALDLTFRLKLCNLTDSCLNRFALISKPYGELGYGALQLQSSKSVQLMVKVRDKYFLVKGSRFFKAGRYELWLKYKGRTRYYRHVQITPFSHLVVGVPKDAVQRYFIKKNLTFVIATSVVGGTIMVGGLTAIALVYRFDKQHSGLALGISLGAMAAWLVTNAIYLGVTNSKSKSPPRKVPKPQPHKRRTTFVSIGP